MWWGPLAAICAAAFAAEVPFFFFGTPSGHDFEFHLYSWLEVISQWKLKVPYPRWSLLAHFGYGEPRFLFYPPASWTLGGLISLIVPWSIASCVYIWLALVLAGASMFVLTRRWFGRREAIFAAVFYAVNPYHLVIVYWRSAFAELLASCLVPLLLLLVVKVAEDNRRLLIPLAVVLAAAWLTNAPAAIMIHYSLALLLVLLAWQRRSFRPVLLGAGAVALGACLAAFYLVPAIYEQKWINVAEAVSAGSRPADNFLFIHTGDADHDAFNRVTSWVAVLEIVITLGAAWAARSWRDSQRALWNTLVAWALLLSVGMFSVTAVAWRFFPKLEFMQFPWRWLLCLSCLLTIFVTAGVRRWWMRVAICAVALLVIATAWHRIQAPWWDNAADLREMQDNMVDGSGYEGVEEYAPIGADPAAIEKDTRKVRGDGTAHAEIHVLRWDPESMSFTAQMSGADRLALRLFHYPAWRVEVNGRLVETSVREGTGQILVPVEAGLNRVEITFLRTWDRTAGGVVSAVAWLGLIGWYLRKRSLAARSPS